MKNNTKQGTKNKRSQIRDWDIMYGVLILIFDTMVGYALVTHEQRWSLEEDEEKGKGFTEINNCQQVHTPKMVPYSMIVGIVITTGHG